MKAVIQTAYGAANVLHLQSIDQPVPDDNEVLVRIKASSVTTADAMMRSGTPRYGRLFLGLFKPRIPISGTGFSGVIESVGKNVVDFKIGESVFGESVLGAGTNTEFVCVPEEGVVVRKPASISHAEAAPVCDGAMTAMYMLECMGSIEAKNKVLINGAAGSLGSAAVQLAHQVGAEVTGVCSQRNFDFVRSLGADKVIDYNETDVTAQTQKYDLIFDSVGKLSYTRSKRILNNDGAYLSPVLSLSLLIHVLMVKLKIVNSRKALFSATGLLPEDTRRSMLLKLSERLDTGALRTIVDRRYQLVDIVNAHHYLDTGHKRANVVIVMDDQREGRQAA
ncbi:MAG: NADPH:quinone reductase-like Zn-dependent oxidoreductase [Patiriisocius sp.]|jgi:NADPH:quinone reductase-like Zn-dependent oxidoreductase